MSAERLADRIREVAPALQIVPVDARPLEDAEVAYFDADLFAEDLSKSGLARLVNLGGLRWLHTFMGGTDHPLYQQLVARGVALTNSAGARTAPMVEHVVAMMLLAAKRMDRWWDAQREHAWRPHRAEELTGKTVGIIGLGRVGGEVARLAKAFRMNVIGCRRSAKRSPYVDRMVRPQDVDTLLSASDFVVLSAPATPETIGWIGEAKLRRMRRSAWLINVARGQIVDEPALQRALREGWIGGACLDVFVQIPLSADSEFWSLPNVIVTPHSSAGRTNQTVDRVDAMFLDNLRRYVAGGKLSNRVRPLRAI